MCHNPSGEAYRENLPHRVRQTQSMPPPASLPRDDFKVDRWALPSSLRCFDASVGVVWRRILGRTVACRIRSISLDNASSRLRPCDRCSSAVITKTPSRFSRRPTIAARRALTPSGNVGDRSTSNRNSTAVDVLLTCCPPGPDARTKDSTISSRSIERLDVIGIEATFGTGQACRSRTRRHPGVRRSARTARHARGGVRAQAETPCENAPRNRDRRPHQFWRRRSEIPGSSGRPSAIGSSTPEDP